jgi:hypothetical protein
MSLRILFTDEKKASPCIICDHCDQIIRTAKDGNSLWLEDISYPRIAGKTVEIKNTHKKCNYAFERANPAESDQCWMSHELTKDLTMLLENIALTKQSAAKAQTALISQLQ